VDVGCGDYGHAEEGDGKAAAVEPRTRSVRPRTSSYAVSGVWQKGPKGPKEHMRHVPSDGLFELFDAFACICFCQRLYVAVVTVMCEDEVGEG
jgi:hypothetical protein